VHYCSGLQEGRASLKCRALLAVSVDFGIKKKIHFCVCRKTKDQKEKYLDSDKCTIAVNHKTFVCAFLAVQ